MSILQIITHRYVRKRPAQAARKGPVKKKQKVATVPAAKAILVPAGQYRTGGAYMRSHPSNFEKKYFDTAFGSTNITLAGVFTSSWNLIPQATTKNARIGNKCTLTNINVHGFVALASQTANNVLGDKVRWIVFVDRQANGAVPAAISDLIQTMPGATTDIHSFRNMDNVDRFVILKDKTYTLNQGSQSGALGSAQVLREIKMNKKCNIPLEFSSTTGVITEIRSNNVMSLFINTAGNNLSAYAMTVRVKFSDF